MLVHFTAVKALMKHRTVNIPVQMEQIQSALKDGVVFHTHPVVQETLTLRPLLSLLLLSRMSQKIHFIADHHSRRLLICAKPNVPMALQTVQQVWHVMSIQHVLQVRCLLPRQALQLMYLILITVARIILMPIPDVVKLVLEEVHKSVHLMNHASLLRLVMQRPTHRHRLRHQHQHL